MPTLHELELSLEKQVDSNSWHLSEIITNNQRSQFSTKIIFTPLLAIHFLSFVSTTLPQKLSKHIFKLLSNQKATNRHTWNYLLNDNHKTYPDDLDSTTLALHTAWKLTSDTHEQILASFINLLISQEKISGGPYRTWFFDKNHEYWGKDVDLVTNFRVWEFLQELKINLPNLKNWILAEISLSKTSPYYPIFETRLISLKFDKDFSLSNYQPANYYEIARFITAVLERPDHHLFLPKIFPYYKQILELPISQLHAFPAFLDHSTGIQNYWVGSSFLTQCACLQALHSYQIALANQVTYSHQQQLVQKISLLLKKNLQSLSDDHCALAYQHCLPFISIDSPALRLFSPPATFLNSKQMQQFWEILSVATSMGWAGYTLHDECIDENADSAKIVLSRILSQLSLTTFLQFISNHNQPNFLKHWLISIYQKMEQTYFFDIHKKPTSQPYYGWEQHIFERAEGLIIAPILLQHTINPTVTNLVVAEKICQPLIIARQLFDDLLDWQTDWKTQTATPITWQIHQLLQATNPSLSPAQPSCLAHRQILPEILIQISNLLEKSNKQLQTTQMSVLAEFIKPELLKLNQKLIEIRAEQKLLDALSSQYLPTPTPPPPPLSADDPTHLLVASPP